MALDPNFHYTDIPEVIRLAPAYAQDMSNEPQMQIDVKDLIKEVDTLVRQKIQGRFDIAEIESNCPQGLRDFAAAKVACLLYQRYSHTAKDSHKSEYEGLLHLLKGYEKAIANGSFIRIVNNEYVATPSFNGPSYYNQTPSGLVDLYAKGPRG